MRQSSEFGKFYYRVRTINSPPGLSLAFLRSRNSALTSFRWILSTPSAFEDELKQKRPAWWRTSAFGSFVAFLRAPAKFAPSPAKAQLDGMNTVPQSAWQAPSPSPPRPSRTTLPLSPPYTPSTAIPWPRSVESRSRARLGRSFCSFF